MARRRRSVSTPYTRLFQALRDRTPCWLFRNQAKERWGTMPPLVFRDRQGGHLVPCHAFHGHRHPSWGGKIIKPGRWSGRSKWCWTQANNGQPLILVMDVDGQLFMRVNPPSWFIGRWEKGWYADQWMQTSYETFLDDWQRCKQLLYRLDELVTAKWENLKHEDTGHPGQGLDAGSTAEGQKVPEAPGPSDRSG